MTLIRWKLCYCSDLLHMKGTFSKGEWGCWLWRGMGIIMGTIATPIVKGQGITHLSPIIVDFLYFMVINCIDAVLTPFDKSKRVFAHFCTCHCQHHYFCHSCCGASCLFSLLIFYKELRIPLICISYSGGYLCSRNSSWHFRKSSYLGEFSCDYCCVVGSGRTV